MALVTRMFNGSVLNFAGAPVARVAGLSYSTGGQWVEVTEPADLNKLWEVSSQPDFALRVRFKGHCGLTYKAKGAIAIAWADGTQVAAPGVWQVGPMEDTGDWDAPITGTAELRPTVPDSE